MFHCLSPPLPFFGKVTNEEDFIRKLDCKPDQHLKVVSIFGNTGDGKSHTLNHTFFYGREVFKTSPAQESLHCGSVGSIWPSPQSSSDRHGRALGSYSESAREHGCCLRSWPSQTSSSIELIQTDCTMASSSSLGMPQKLIWKHFTKELKSCCPLWPGRPLVTLGPAVIIFETVHTQLLGSGKYMGFGCHIDLSGFPGLQ